MNDVCSGWIRDDVTFKLYLKAVLVVYFETVIMQGSQAGCTYFALRAECQRIEGIVYEGYSAKSVTPVDAVISHKLRPSGLFTYPR